MNKFNTRSRNRLVRRKVRLSKRARVVRAAAVVAALAVSGLTVSQASYSAFSATVSNDGNNWTAAKLGLTSSVTKALFAETHLIPGSTGSKDITITNTSDAGGTVRLYATKETQAAGDIAKYIHLTVTGTASDGKQDSVYDGVLSDFLTKNTYADGKGAWTPKAANESEKYTITWSLEDSAPDSVQGQNVSAGLTWEMQSGK